MTLEPDQDGGSAPQRDTKGAAVLDRVLVLDQWACEPPPGDFYRIRDKHEHAKVGDLSVALFAPSPNG